MVQQLRGCGEIEIESKGESKKMCVGDGVKTKKNMVNSSGRDKSLQPKKRRKEKRKAVFNGW